MKKKKVLMSLILLIVIGISAVFAQQATLDKLSIRRTTSSQDVGPASGVRALNNNISGSIVIPDTHEGTTVTQINTEGFLGITGITSVTIPQSVTFIAARAFRGCTGLTSITIPARVVNIQDHAFADNPNLTSVTFQGVVRSIYNNTFPGDLRAKHIAGGAGVYTRTAGGTVWTRIGDAPAVAVVNTSLNGVWDINGGGLQITISGSTGTFSRIDNPRPLWADAISKGYVKIGDQYWRNIRSTGTLTWSGQTLLVIYDTPRPNIAVRTEWTSCTITMNANGQTIDVTSTSSGSGTGTETFTRR